MADRDDVAGRDECSAAFQLVEVPPIRRARVCTRTSLLNPMLTVAASGGKERAGIG